MSDDSRHTATDARRTLRLSAATASDLARAENASFSVVECADVARYLRACDELLGHAFRVLEPGGVLEFEDLVLPEHTASGMFVDSLERLCDPAHVKARTVAAWTKSIEASGFVVQSAAECDRRWSFSEWCGAEERDEEYVDSVIAMVARMPAKPAEWLAAEWESVADPEVAPQDQARTLVGFRRRVVAISARRS